MFEAEVSNLDAGDELDLVHGVDLVQLGQDLAGVGGEGHQDRQVGQGHQSNIVLRVGAGLGVGDQVHSILTKKSHSFCFLLFV